ncbi:RluA family pseudouridine synthase [Gillisia sp. M10.2A]|uniref:RluA family pseudouridine synthase n=1 Tax=Gillisia lutea TaxID=2909668 RepID=A0ABS9EBM9_9FLAO|nr:RluA family pseudouridine synthase [Gillisia lutea]MCF4100294.1 RluA family pseudouridine synthase [Gillisia lutea]
MKVLETHIVPAMDKEIRLQEYAPGIFYAITTKSGIKKAIKREEILIDGKIAQTSDWVKENQKIELLQQKVSPKKIFQLKLEVIFEDEYFAIVNKPSGYPTSGNYFKTIENALPFNLEKSNKQDALPYPLPVHRLDNPTSGLLAIAKTRAAQITLNSYFETKEIRKIYVALVHGHTPETLSLTTNIDEKSALTKLKTLRHFNFKDQEYSLVELSPETGRTHQLRIHLASHNFPIVGEKQYANNENDFKNKGLFLAAVGLKLNHPIHYKELTFSIDLPAKFKKAISF